MMNKTYRSIISLSAVMLLMGTQTAFADETVSDLAVAQCEESINVRSEASADSEVIGQIYNNGTAHIIETDGDWYKIQSGNAIGYVKAEYFVTGTEAEQIAEQEAYHVAVVYPEQLYVRVSPDQGSEVLDTAEQSAELEVVADEEGWMKVALAADSFGYVNADYVETKTYYPTALTLEEIAAKEAEAAAQNEAAVSDGQEADEAETAEDYEAGVENGVSDYSEADSAGSSDYSETDSDGTSDYSEADGTGTTDYSEADSTETTDYSETDSAGTSDYSEADSAGTTDYSEADSTGTTDYSETDSAGTSDYSEADSNGISDYTEDYSSTDETQSDTYYETEAPAQEEYYETEAPAQEETEGYTAAEETTDTSSSDSSTGQSVADYAVQFVGNPYAWGGTSLTNGADCSGFVQSVFANFGIGLARTAADQSYGGTSVSIDSIQAGDLLFYSDGSGISHVAIYIGGGQIVHAANAQSGITISNYNYSSPVSASRYW